MKLVEVIPGSKTSGEIACKIAGFLDQRLGKGVVPAKDRPNFIANRIGVFGMMATIHEMIAMGFTPTEIDQMTGKAIGHASSATFRTSDLVGLDVTAHVTTNLYPAVPDDEDREVFQLPDLIKTLLEKKLLGDKTKGGFYKKSTDAEGKRVILELDLATFEYKPQEKTKFPSLDAAKAIEDTAKRVKTLVWGDDRVGEFLWKTTSRVSRYAANRIPEIADTIVEIDNAIKWGFGWEIGVFEAWDAIGVRESVERMKKEGQAIPANVRKDARRRCRDVLQERERQLFVLRSGRGRIQTDARSSGRDGPQNGQRTHRRYQNKSGCVADRHRRRRCVSRISLKDELDRRRHRFDDEFCDRRGREKFQRPRRRQSGRQFFGRCKYHDAPARRSGRGVGRHQHDGRRPCKKR